MTTHDRPILDRVRLGELADALLPGGSGLPSATEAAVLDGGVDRVLAVRPTLVDALVRVAALDGAPAHALSQLADDDPASYSDFVLVVAGAYFTESSVRRALGYPGLAPRKLPPAPGEADYYLENNLLQPVLDRGPLYREVPDGPPPSGLADVSEKPENP